MKLIIISEMDAGPKTRTIEYDGRPKMRPVKRCTHTDEGGWEDYSMHFVWCYYKASLRVATVVIYMGDGNIPIKNRMRQGECWPCRVKLRGKHNSFAWFHDGTWYEQKPVKLAPGRDDDAFAHPRDDDAFNRALTDILSGDDRDWIRECDEAARAGGKVEDGAAAIMLTIREAAAYARVDERTIRNWLDRSDGDKPMLPGAIKAGRMIRIPRSDLDPWRKVAKATRTPKALPRKQTARKAVKQKS